MRRLILATMLAISFLMVNTINAEILFEDDFNDGVIDSSKWILGVTTGGGPAPPPGSVGSYVEETNGILRIVQGQTNWGGKAYTVPITVNLSEPITITKRTRMHYTNRYYGGSVSIHEVDSSGNSIQWLSNIGYYNYSYGGNNWFGFGNPHLGGLLPPIWDTWFNETIVYDPVTGETEYTINDGATIVIVGNAIGSDMINYHLSSYGWWTGHYQELDYIRIEQSASNLPPEIGEVDAPLDPVAVGALINASADFIDQGKLDTHTAIWNWGDGSDPTAGIVTEENGFGTVSGSYTYTNAGVYTITLTVTDDHDDSDQSVFQYVVVYNPAGGFVTGGGWIDSPAGAYTADSSLVGKVNFGFVSKYKKGADVPTGRTEFNFRLADLNFRSINYDWLVIAGANAKYKGTGTINNEGDYRFMITATDGDLNSGVDKFRIKIWDKATDELVYDNKKGEDDDSHDAQEIDGGSIVVHKGSKDKGVSAPAKLKPGEFTLLQNWPNPFNPETWIPYQLAEDTDVTISIHDLSGRLVRLLDLGYSQAGAYSTKEKALYWNGRNEAGEEVSSGVYFYTIRAGSSYTATRKMIIAR